MNKCRDIMGRVNYALFLAVVALLPFPQIFLRYACVLWFIMWVLEGRWLTNSIHTSYIIHNKSSLPFLLFGLWYIWKLVSGLWATDHIAWAWQMERYITFGVMIPVGIWGLNDRYNWSQIGKVFVMGCVCAAIVYPVLLTVLLFHREIIDTTNWMAPWDYSSFEWLYFYQTNLSHIKHRLFLCSVEIMGIVVATKLWFTERRRVWYLVTALLTGSILLSGSRQALVSLIIIAVISLFWLLSNRLKWYHTAGIILVAVLLGGLALSFHPRLQTTDIHSEERMIIWKTALQQPMNYFWGGLGAGQDGVYLFSSFPETEMPQHFTIRGHCHNQYLQEWRELGIFGLLLFVIAWISIPLCAPQEEKRTAILFTTLYACNMCTDCMFSNYCGVALWAVGLLFILLQSHPESKQQTAGDTEA